MKSPSKSGTHILPSIKLSLDTPTGMQTLVIIPARSITWARK